MNKGEYITKEYFDKHSKRLELMMTDFKNDLKIEFKHHTTELKNEFKQHTTDLKTGFRENLRGIGDYIKSRTKSR